VRLGRVAACVGVRDMARARAFYEGVLGLAATFENGDPVSFVILKRDGAELHLALAPDETAPAFNVAHLMVEAGVDELHRRCVEAGARIVSPLRDAPWRMRTFVVADPDGNRLDVGQPL
jgi:catechol 2,3-dioxygenase-like lactoylglutathione lyase family enzyme